MQHRSLESIAELAAGRREIKSLSLFRQRFVLWDELQQWIWMSLEGWAVRLLKFRPACTFSSNSLLYTDFGQNFQARISIIMFAVTLKRAPTALVCSRLLPVKQCSNTQVMRCCWAVVLLPGACIAEAEDRLFGDRNGFSYVNARHTLPPNHQIGPGLLHFEV